MHKLKLATLKKGHKCTWKCSAWRWLGSKPSSSGHQRRDAHKPPKPVRWVRPSPPTQETRKEQLGSGFLAPFHQYQGGTISHCVQCVILSHMLMSPGNYQDWLEARRLYLIWDGLISWLCLMFTWNPLSPPQLKVSVFVGVCPMATCFQKCTI